MLIFVVAPHLIYPPKNASCKYILHRYTTIDKIEKVIFLGKYEILIFKNKKLINKYLYQSKKLPTSKIIPALKSLLFKKNYLYEKQNMSMNFLNNYLKVLNKFKPKAIIFSYLDPLIFINKKKLLSDDKNYICERHNDDVNWFNSLKYDIEFKLSYLTSIKDIYKFFYKKLFNTICKNSINWTINNLESVDVNVKHIFLTNLDKKNCSKYMDTRNSKVISLSNEIINENREIKNTFENGLKKISKCNLLFVGNLDLKMNYDSLKFFSDKFYPNIVKFAKREVVVNIVGFNPSNNVKRLSLENNWNLISDATNKELFNFYNQSHYSILPFRYTNGFKTKFIESIVYGLPMIGTENLNYLRDKNIPLSLFSDSPKEWIRQINILFEISYEEFFNIRKSITGFKKYFDHQEITNQLYNYLIK